MGEPLEYKKHERFCVEYCWDLDGGAAILRTRAYKRQEYDGERWVDVAELNPEERKDRNYAARIARRLLRYPDIQDRIDELLEEKRLQTKIKHEQLEQKLLSILDKEPRGNPTHNEILSVIEKLARRTNFYAEENKNQVDAVGKMFSQIFGQKDDLPKLTKPNEPGSTTTPDSAEAG